MKLKLEQAEYKVHLTKEIEGRVVYVNNKGYYTNFYDRNDNRIYIEFNNEYWMKNEYDEDGEGRYWEDSVGDSSGKGE